MTVKTIFNTEDCFRGFSVEEDCFVSGNLYELCNSTDIEQESIVWSDQAFEEQKEYFMSFLNAAIEAYEKRYRTTVTHLALAGHVGRWNGNFVGGKVIEATESPLEHMGSVDHVDVTVDADGVISINGHHHDGTHTMQLYLLTENKLHKVAPDFLCYGEVDYRDMQTIYDELKPLKLGNVGVNYYGALKH